LICIGVPVGGLNESSSFDEACSAVSHVAASMAVTKKQDTRKAIVAECRGENPRHDRGEAGISLLPDSINILSAAAGYRPASTPLNMDGD
jgi:hypothetical protein